MPARRPHILLAVLSVISSLTLVPGSFVRAQNGGTTKKVAVSFPKAPPTGPPAIVTGPVMPIKLSITDEKVTNVDILVSSIARPGLTYTLSLTRQQADRALPFEIYPYAGVNSIKLFAIRGEVADTKPSDEIRVQCDPPFCGADRKIPSPGEMIGPPKEGQQGGGGGQQPSATGGNLKIRPLTSGADPLNTDSVEPLIIVQPKSGTTKLSIDVYNNGVRIDHQDGVKVESVPEAGIGLSKLKLKIATGKNEIRVYDPLHLNDKAFEDLAIVNCAGNKCKPPEVAAASSLTDTSTDVFKIELPTDVSDKSTVSPVISVAKASNIKKIKVEVSHGDKPPRTSEALVSYVDDKPGVANPTIKVLQGKNVIRVYDAENVATAKAVEYSCDNVAKCATFFENITVAQPMKGYIADNEPSVSSRIGVQKASGINRLIIRVTDQAGNIVEDESNAGPIAVEFPEGATSVELPRQIRVVEGTNTVTVYGMKEGEQSIDFTNKDNQATFTVPCRGNKCGLLDQSGSQNVRMTVGFEQAGASSTTSETKPFLDFFFTTPLRFGAPADLIPDLSAWGQIRFSTTPEQTSAVGAFPSNLINQVSQSRETVGLVQSFDYLAGLEWHAFPGNGTYLGLGPNGKRAHFYLAAGGGAISPLTSKKESVQIFKVPAAGSSQRALFESRFGAEAAAKTYIGFVFPERDRFLRQFYGGLRIKAFDCADSACSSYANRFPATFDFMFGQNEAATGGRLKNDVTDENGKIIGRKRSYVLRFDAFYPLSFRGVGINLYGTALLKVGRGGPQITTPLFLDQAEGSVLITNTEVFVAPNLQLDRDYYKIGVGFDLMRLFRRQNQ